MTHWSSRLLADAAGDRRTPRWPGPGVTTGCSRGGRETFKFSTDPELVAKVRDVVGLYLAPPENAVVLCVDEKSQIQALDRTAPMLPMQPGPAGAAHPRLRPARHHDPVRGAGDRHRQGHRAPASHGTATRSSCAFLKQVARAYPERKLHLVMDNYATHKHPRSRPGWPQTRGSACTSPRPPAPG